MNTSENRQSGSSNEANGERITIPVRQEEISVGKESVDTGKGVRVEKRVREEPQTIHETLRHDEIDIRRVPVDRIVESDEEPQSRYEGNTLIVPVCEEILVVEKKLRVKEEIHITKAARDTIHSEVVHLKSEEVSIERFDEHTTGNKGRTPEG